LKTNRTLASKLAATTLFRLSACLLLAVGCTGFAQTLARPGWTASGFSADPWWKHAVFYEVKGSAVASAYEAGDAPVLAVDWANDPKAISEKLEWMQSLGVDAVVFPMPAQEGSSDNFDDLVRQASQRGIHVLLEFPASGASGDLADRARLWLSRGVAGFCVVASDHEGEAGDSQAVVQMLRRIANTAVGGRIVLSKLPAEKGAATAVVVIAEPRRATGSSSGRAAGQGAAQLQIDARPSLPAVPDAWGLRLLLEQQAPDANVLLDLQQPVPSGNAPDRYGPLAMTIAAAVLTTRPAAVIDADQMLSRSGDAATADLGDWYRRLIALHHGNATLRYGSATVLNFDAQNALVWVSRASAGTGLAAPVVVACNLSSSPIYLSLGPPMKDLNLHGSFLRTLLRTDSGMGPQDLNSVMVPAYGVYIGELHR